MFFVGISNFIMDSESECATAVILVAAISKKRKRIRKKRLRSIWVKPWLGRRNEPRVAFACICLIRIMDWKSHISAPPKIDSFILKFWPNLRLLFLWNCSYKKKSVVQTNWKVPMAKEVQRERNKWNFDFKNSLSHLLQQFCKTRGDKNQCKMCHVPILLSILTQMILIGRSK